MLSRLNPLRSARVSIAAKSQGHGVAGGRHLGRVSPAIGAPLAAVCAYDANHRYREAALIFDKDGKVLKSLSAPGATFREVAWSPNGDRLAYVLESPHEERITQLHVYDVQAQMSLPIAEESLNVWPAFSRDGNVLAWVRRPEISGENGGNPQQILLHDMRTGGQRRIGLKPGEYAFAVRWSPADDSIAVAVTTTSFSNDQPKFHRDLSLISPGEEMARLTTFGDVGRYAWAWSPDGQGIALVRNIATDQNARGGPAGIWIVDVKTKIPRRAPTGEELNGLSIESLSWHPSGKWLFLSAYNGPERSVYRLDVTSGEIKRLTSNSGSEYGEYWPAVGGIVFLRNGSEIWTCRHDGSRAGRLL